MKTIKETMTNNIIIKNSKFITLLMPLNKEEELDSFLDKVKSEYKKANHYCYAYIIDDIKRSNDDGEPTGTAGAPILNVLEKNDLNNILCIVVRYFGGIKLGAGGLIRAYSSCVRETLKLADTFEVNEEYLVTFSFPHDSLKKINIIIGNIEIVKKEFKEMITYTIKLNNDQINIIDILNENEVIILKTEKVLSIK